ncbi:hypothetical protein [Nocardioides bruguierae]|uniref:Uncharacterized protein n=1 Tax=Nocardioides bruguierae TaxID=2945102 RepID=A0A9X2DBC8_9ACTN|nr:hypothetical protein [Nocardioides bruguierae]MCM0622713.1 hypothetical protein [Nocardioides bruguierae]
MRRLTRTLIARGVVYPVGTSEADIPGTVHRDDVWDGPRTADPAPSSGPGSAEPAEPAGKYDGWRIDRLRNEATARGLDVPDPKDKEAIRASLVADDATSS